MIALIDTNVILDYFLNGVPFYEDSERVFSACVDRKVKGVLAAHSISNLFFIMRKQYSVKERKEILQIFVIHQLILCHQKNILNIIDN